MHLINVFCRNQQLCKCGGVWSGGAGCGPECLGIISIEKMETLTKTWSPRSCCLELLPGFGGAYELVILTI